MSDQPPRPRLADLDAPDPALPDVTEGFDTETELVSVPDLTLAFIAGELGVIVLLLIGVLLTVILRS